MSSLLALSWALLTIHCQVEAMPGFEFLRCSPAPVSEPACHNTSDCDSNHRSSPGQSSDPCEENGCCAIESAQYHVPRQQHEGAPTPVIAIAAPNYRVVIADSLPKDVNHGFLTTAPPELVVSWRFAFRTALPPRAPSSFVS
jgi:hypothetical protein